MRVLRCVHSPGFRGAKTNGHMLASCLPDLSCRGAPWLEHNASIAGSSKGAPAAKHCVPVRHVAALGALLSVFLRVSALSGLSMTPCASRAKAPGCASRKTTRWTMANARCENCGKIVPWRAGRGASLSELRCACGGTLRGLTSGRPSLARGKRYERCGVCGRKRLSGYLVTLTRAAKRLWGHEFPAGTRSCAHHEFVDANATYGWSFAGELFKEVEGGIR